MLVNGSDDLGLADDEDPPQAGGVPAWLESPPDRTPLVTGSRVQILPFENLTPENFERLVLKLARPRQERTHAQLYGEPGQDQHGIDLYVRMAQPGATGRFYRTVQCRNVADVTATDLASAIEDFLDGIWAKRTDTFVFATRVSTVRSQRAEAIEAAAARLRAVGIAFEVWDGETLSEMLRTLPDVVDRFFGREATTLFCGPDAASWHAGAHARVDPVRVSEASPRLLGVHASIQVGEPSNDLPTYVRRDFDDDLERILRAGSGGGCFLLLVGRSSVGKTRSLRQAVTTVMPDWWLIHPNQAADLERLAASPAAQTVVWLDEIQQYLDIRDGLDPGTVRSLLRAGAVIVGTMWPDDYGQYIRIQPGGDHHARVRSVLGLAEIMQVPDTFSREELCIARDAADRDGRLRVALSVQDAGVAQVLAGGPQLVQWWEHAPDRYGQALISAAVDARHLGIHVPLTRQLLAEAVPGYLDSSATATAPKDWLERAFDHATTKLLGASAALNPLGGNAMGETVGYIAADFLLQHGRRTRRTICPPASTWQALGSHIENLDALLDLAGAAEARMLYCYSRPLYQRLEDSGHLDAIGPSLEFERLLAVCDLEGAIALCWEWEEEGDTEAIDQLIWALESAGYVDAAVAESRGRKRSAWYSKTEVVAILSRNARIEDLTELADAGDDYAARRLAFVLLQQGRPREALQRLRPQDYEGNPARGWVQAYIADCLAVLGNIEELRVRADSGEEYAEARMLASLGHYEKLQERAEAGDDLAGSLIATALVEAGHIDEAVKELQRRTDENDEGEDITPSEQLADLLAAHGQLDELAAELRAGNTYAGKRYADLLAQRGNIEDADLLRHFGVLTDGSIARPC